MNLEKEVSVIIFQYQNVSTMANDNICLCQCHSGMLIDIITAIRSRDKNRAVPLQGVGH